MLLAIAILPLAFFACTKNEGSNREKVNPYLQQLNQQNNYEHADSVLQYVNGLLAESTAGQQLSADAKLDAYQIKLKIFQQQGTKDSMVYFANERCKLAESRTDTQQIVNTLSVITFDEFNQVHIRILEKWVGIAIDYLQKRPPTPVHAHLYATYGSLLNRDDRKLEAIEWLLKAYRIYEKQDALQALGAVCINIGNVYSAIKSDEEALTFQRLAADYLRQAGDFNQLAAALSNIGVLYISSHPDSAIYYFQYVIDSLPTANQIPAKYNIANLLANELQRTDEAMALYLKVKKESEQNDIFQGVLYAKAGIGNIYLKKNNYTQALAYYQETAREADSVGFRELANSVRANIILAYEEQGNYKEAFRLLRALETHKDSALSLEKQIAIHELELFYQTENQRLENKNLLTQIENQKLTARYRLLIVSLLLTFLTTTVILVVRKNRIKAKQLRELEEKYHLLAEIERIKSEQAEFLEKIVGQQQDELISIAKENELMRSEFADKPLLPLLNSDDESPDFIGNKTYWQNLSLKFDLIYPGFVEGLTKNHPRLTQNDIQFCMLIKLNIPLKDIASIFNISMPGIYKKKYRLEEKLNLKGNDDRLHGYIAQL
jgi:tetratricopeptide (TPR) repeat protein